MSCRPSELLGIDDLYTAFCFDEACAYIIKRISQDEDEPILKKREKEGKKESKRIMPSDIFKKYDNVKIHK